MLERLSVRDVRDEGGSRGESPSPPAKAESVDAPPKRKSPATTASVSMSFLFSLARKAAKTLATHAAKRASILA